MCVSSNCQGKLDLSTRNTYVNTVSDIRSIEWLYNWIVITVKFVESFLMLIYVHIRIKAELIYLERTKKKETSFVKFFKRSNQSEKEKRIIFCYFYVRTTPRRISTKNELERLSHKHSWFQISTSHVLQVNLN